ncbi:hypothetical protein KTO58_16935 [Chitinophaga pendula]|uniref:hypothetical protein n=1 Tax=Chitinophaga TaxID=79328 RepID=UPI000BB04889|nr:MULTISPECIES: hypothetical protein [Chitinophaga]ASZ11615.1 hypothetical protein CK934_11910 [Chitinophaga sp. MD30]UCJ05375.1 hypothetical protein KTO58_16935 [Chitinophaga pendula]
MNTRNRICLFIMLMATGWFTSSYSARLPFNYIWFDVNRGYKFKCYGTEAQALASFPLNEYGLLAYGYDPGRWQRGYDPFYAVVYEGPHSMVVVYASLIRDETGKPYGNSLIIDNELYR